MNQNDKEIALKTLGVELKQLRNLANLTQSEFAQLAGVSQTLITFVENGKRTASKKGIDKITDALWELGYSFNNGTYESYIKYAAYHPPRKTGSLMTERFRSLRKKLGVSVLKQATHMRVSVNTCRSIERINNQIPIEYACWIQDFFATHGGDITVGEITMLMHLHNAKIDLSNTSTPQSVLLSQIAMAELSDSDCRVLIAQVNVMLTRAGKPAVPQALTLAQ